MECEKNGGFYSKNVCIFVIRSQIPISWDGLFLACEQSGALPAHLYDTGELMEHVWAYLLQNVRCIIIQVQEKYNIFRTVNWGTETLDVATAGPICRYEIGW